MSTAWYEVPSDKKKMICVFKSTDDMWRYADTEPPCMTHRRTSRIEDDGDGDWHGTQDWEKGFALGTKRGWVEGARRMREMRKKLKALRISVKGERRRKIIAPTGGKVHIPRFLAGDVKHMVRYKKKRTADGTNASIGVECGVLSYGNVKAIMNRGVAVATLIKAIEDMGISVELTGLHTARSGDRLFTTAHKIKRAGSYCNDERIAMALGNPATHRRCVFSVRETVPEKIFKSYLKETMGSTTDTPEEMRRELKIDYHLGNIHSGGFDWNDPTTDEMTDWVMEKLAEIAKTKNIKTL